MPNSKRSFDKANIFFLANPYSPHVRHWECLLGYGSRKMAVITAHRAKSDPLVSVPVYNLLPGVLDKIPFVLRYILLGLYIRFFCNKKTIPFVHAHNTSGYGLSALLSGRPYIVTTYGSEIFDSQARGWLYCVVIRAILRKATAITSTSPKMTDSLVRSFGVDRTKIHEFSLGVSSAFFFDKMNRRRIRENLGFHFAPVWIVNRRIHPLYHTIELVKAFASFRKTTGVGFLMVLEGDSDSGYLAEVERICGEVDGVKLIRGFMAQDDLRGYLSAADFSISVPESDQLSSSILEGAVCGAIPLLADLESYAPVRGFSVLFKIPNPGSAGSYDLVFKRSYEMMLSGDYEYCRRDMFEKLGRFTMDAALPEVNDLYGLIR
ncbi:glycosyltransferase [Pseudomonas sp.]|uniref:glycosyltransferase n=1 Tax=Pseudomonas sp. TaxID=306 RepID=UPI002736144A|nr:glycosyltransferase [Pseudomonas sp.]MDP3816904.1 glycosyltransferase [Pseudomonas sp.]